MINHPAFSVEPWALRATELELAVLALTESVFALANGHIGWRGNLDEGEPHGLPGSYLNGVYELRPLPYAEAGYGYLGAVVLSRRFSTSSCPIRVRNGWFSTLLEKAPTGHLLRRPSH